MVMNGSLLFLISGAITNAGSLVCVRLLRELVRTVVIHGEEVLCICWARVPFHGMRFSGSGSLVEKTTVNKVWPLGSSLFGNWFRLATEQAKLGAACSGGIADQNGMQ